jgi:SAM-dependent methyltransferase
MRAKRSVMSETDASGFTETQRAHAYPAGIERHFWMLSRSRILYDKLRAAGAASPMLDIGCGPGVTVHHLRRRGIDCSGLDLATYPTVLPDIAGAVWYGQDAFTLPEPQRARFRTLLLLDVVEHLADPDSFLRRCAEAYPNVTTMLITVPARQELWSNYDEFYGHQRRYDIGSVTGLCSEAGIEVTECGYFFHALYLTMALQKLLSIQRSVEFEGVRNQPFHDLLAALFYLEEKILPAALPGSSLLVVGRVNR